MAREDFESLVEAVKHVESRGQRYAANARQLLTSHKGAEGEMQVLPKTQKSPGYGIEPAKAGDPEDIARVGREYLRAMLDKYGNREHALAAYNWGPGNVDKWLAKGADPSKLPKETQNYLIKVNKRLGTQTADVSRETSPPAPTEAEKVVEPALRSGMSAQAPAPASTSVQASEQLAAMGPSYQAALALAVLSDVDEEERKDRDIDDDREPSISQKWLMEQGSRPTALASLSDISIKSPFPEQAPVRMADGGEATKEVKTPDLLTVPLYAETVSYEMYPGQQGQYDQRDAARHMLAAGTLAMKYGPTAAEMLGKLHEIKTSPLSYIGSKLGLTQMPDDYEQDLHNNKLGIDIGLRAKSQKELEELVMQAAERAQKAQTAGQAWISRPQKPVKRAEGSPEEGEMAEASRPATVNPMIRRQGEAARRLAALRDVNTLPDPKTYAAVSGFLGTPPDEQGFSVLHPDYEGIKSAGEKGYVAGLGAQIAPMAGALRGLKTPSGTTAQKMLAGMKDVPVGASVKPVEPFFQHTPSAETPFVGRLDEFVASMQTPVRKDQFLGQLKGKFREYDIARAEDALSDLPLNTKLSPSDLLNRLKERYDPATIRTTVRPPEDNRYFAATDNPYHGKPVGVIHMGTHASPEQLQRIENLDKLNDPFSELRSLSLNTSPEVQGLDVLRKDAIASAKLDEIFAARREALAHIRPYLDAVKDLNAYRYPTLDSNFNTVAKQIAAQRDEKYITSEAFDLAKYYIQQQAEQKLLRDFGSIPSSNSEVRDLLRAKYGDQWLTQGQAMELQIRHMSDNLYDYVSQVPAVLGLEKAYRGKSVHRSLQPPANAVGFSRFVEQTAPGPDGKPMKGIHLLEIQSDLTSELKAGSKPELKSKEVFPNMAENRRTVQQLGMKNAIAAAINRGDQFVTFPGAESAKPKLYESVQSNLKQVAKDLGPGFEVRPLEFRNSEGNTMQHWGIVWGPEAAQRIQKKGVPFKDGGPVDKSMADNRKYL